MATLDVAVTVGDEDAVAAATAAGKLNIPIQYNAFTPTREIMEVVSINSLHYLFYLIFYNMINSISLQLNCSIITILYILKNQTSRHVMAQTLIPS